MARGTVSSSSSALSPPSERRRARTRVPGPTPPGGNNGVMTTNALDHTLDALAAARITQLLTADTLPLVREPRERLQRRYPPEGSTLPIAEWKLAGMPQNREGQMPRVRMRRAGIDLWAQMHERNPANEGEPAVVIYTAEKGHPVGNLISCAWCTSPYVATVVVCARRYAPKLWDPLAKVLAFSMVSGTVISQIAH